MWRKRHLPLFFVLFWCLSCASQSWAQSTWDDFDEVVNQIEIELQNLKGNLLIAEQATAASQNELQQAKQQSQAQALLLKKCQDSLKLSEQSAQNFERSLKASERLNIILIITQIMSLIGIGALLL